MHNRAVKKGQKVQVELNTGISKTIIDCYILEPESDRLVLSFPASQKEYIPYLSEGTEIKAFVYSFTGIMIFDSIVFDSPYNGIFVIEFSNQHQVIQRRRYLRMPFITDFFIIGKDEKNNIKTATIDLSGGGVRFLCEDLIEVGKEYEARLRLDEFSSLIKVSGIIIQKNFYRSNEYVMEFLKINEKDRDKIIQKCLLIERLQNSKSNS